MKRNARQICATAVVVLALAEIFCGDFADFSGLPLGIRRVILCAGFGFDLLFTVWFLVGLYTASLNRKTRRFLGAEGGWMDFLGSVPLLVFFSGPAMFSLAAGSVPLLPLLARITRNLRFLRFLKIFRTGFFPVTGRAGKNGAAFFVCVLVLAWAFLVPLISRPGVLEKRILEDYFSTALRLSREPPGGENMAAEYGSADAGLLVIRQEAAVLYSRYDPSYYKRYYSPSDYLWIESRNMDFYFSLKPLLAEEAGLRMSCFCVLAALCVAFFFYYEYHARPGKGIIESESRQR
ncbi:MAG: hypothetical protein LBK13_12720 [Spirochaetales bacterium]|jgi:hypothetical protein|nr:hypothetical protein [Spirochaetales bacterium]